MLDPLTAKAIRRRYPEDGYTAFHAPRYVALLRMLDNYVTADSTILDIGRSRLTELLHERYAVRVDALGFLADEPTPQGHDWWFDLNRSTRRDHWRTDLPRYDVIVMAEVLEHLHVAPAFVFGFLGTLLVPGGVLLIQTPNAVALHKRVEMLTGRNPYEQIRDSDNDPGHFREYTKRELLGLLSRAGFRIDTWCAADYLDYRFVGHDARPRAAGAAVNLLYRLSPSTLRPGQMVVARAPQHDPVPEPRPPWTGRGRGFASRWPTQRPPTAAPRARRGRAAGPAA